MDKLDTINKERSHRVYQLGSKRKRMVAVKHGRKSFLKSGKTLNAFWYKSGYKWLLRARELQDREHIPD